MSTKKGVWHFFKKILPVLILIVTLLLVSIFTLKYVNIAADDRLNKNVIRITASGDVKGSDKICKNGNIYTLIEDIEGDIDEHSVFISIECGNIIFDGAGKTIRGTNGNGVAIKLEKSNVTIKNTRIINFETGIYTRNFQTPVSNIKIIDNYFENNRWVAIDSYKIEGFTISGNTFLKCNPIIADVTTGIIFTNNELIDCGLVYVPDGLNVFYGNTVNGKPLVLFEGQSSQVVDNAGQVILINCTNMIIQNIEEQNLTSAIQLFGTNNTLITNCKSRITLTNSNNNTISNNEINVAKYVTPIWLISSNSNTITNNKLTVVTECAMFIEMSSNNRIAQNLIYGDGITLRDNSEYNKIENNTILANNGSSLKTGIGISSGSNYNYIYENNIANSDNGIYLYTSAYNVIFKNNVCYCKNSLTMSSSTYNDFLGNNFIDAAEQAIYLFRSDYNNFFYNSFEGNTKVTEGHVDTLYNMTFYAEYNRWDNGKEGNYWSDYTGKDNGSGVGETPYVVYDNFTDNYPLTIPYDINKIQVTFEQWNGSSIVS